MPLLKRPRGPGKVHWCAAGIEYKGLVADNEPRAEIYAAATFNDQAMVSFSRRRSIYDQSPELQKRLVPPAWEITDGTLPILKQDHFSG